MDMVSSVKRGISFDPNPNVRKNKGIQGTGDGDGQLSPAFISEEPPEQQVESEYASSDGYEIELNTNAHTRQYSDGVSRISARIGSLHQFGDNLEQLQQSTTQLQERMSGASVLSSEQFYEGGAELVALATDFTSASQNIFGEGESSSEQDAGGRTMPLDLSLPDQAASLLRETAEQTSMQRAALDRELGAVESQVGSLMKEMTFFAVDNPQEAAGDPAASFTSKIGFRLTANGPGVLDAQANIDPEVAIKLLRM